MAMTSILSRLAEVRRDGRKALRLFVVGCVLCTLGLSMVVWIDAYVPDSLRREVATIIALGLAGLGFATAIGAHICLLLQRLRG